MQFAEAFLLAVLLAAAFAYLLLPLLTQPQPETPERPGDAFGRPDLLDVFGAERPEIFGDFPALAFWYGLQPSEILASPRWLVDLYRRDLPRLRAEAIEEAIVATTYPHLEERGRRSVSRALERTRPPLPRSREQLVEAAQESGIRVVKKGVKETA